MFQDHAAALSPAIDTRNITRRSRLRPLLSKTRKVEYKHDFGPADFCVSILHAKLKRLFAPLTMMRS
jgi:hypothetical protein